MKYLSPNVQSVILMILMGTASTVLGGILGTIVYSTYKEIPLGIPLGCISFIAATVLVFKHFRTGLREC
ncbi:MAG: hypothetical protein ABIO57_00985 [Candidatus Paceibacterota bacterium]